MLTRNISTKILNSVNRLDLIVKWKTEALLNPLKLAKKLPLFLRQLIMDEILPRLPVKSLLKFRCVSKPWCSLVGSKRFIKAHLNNSIKNSWFANNCFFIDYAEAKFKQCFLPSMFDKLFAHPISRIGDLGIDKFDVVLPVGSCNGLVCMIVNWRRFILWNPTTKKFNNLPDLFNLIQVKRGGITKYGFRFDELNDDYKVYGIVEVGLEDKPPHYTCMVYSLRSNSWKPIEDTNHVSQFDDEFMGMSEYMGMGMGMLVSGKLHWNKYKGEIVSFDLNRHVSGVVELPSYTEGYLHSVAVLGGCLSAHFVHSNGYLHVWVMKEYGVKESWDKVVTVPYYDSSKIPAPVAIAQNGEVLLANHSGVVIYNPKCDFLRHPEIAARDDGVARYVCPMGIYIESLVSIVPDAQ